MNQLTSLLDEAYELFNQKKFEESLSKLVKAQEMIIDDTQSTNIPRDKVADSRASIENFKGFNYLGLNNTERAHECFENALAINPNSSQACAGLAEIFYLEGMDYEAKIMFEWAIENNTMNQFAIAGLAKVNQALNLPEDHNTLNSETTFFEIKNNEFFEDIKMAYQLFSEKRFSESLATLDRAERKLKTRKLNFNANTKIASLENFRGFNLLALDRITEARQSFEKALNINPSSSQACAGLGEIFYLTGRETEAKTMFEWAVANNERNHFAAERLKKVNKEMGLPEDDNSLMNTDVTGNKKTETEQVSTTNTVV